MTYRYCRQAEPLAASGASSPLLPRQHSSGSSEQSYWRLIAHVALCAATEPRNLRPWGKWNSRRTKRLDSGRKWRHKGAMALPERTVTDLDRINLRLSKETFDAIDHARTARPGRVSRNTWIAEAIDEKLTRGAVERPALMGKAGNA